MKRFVCGLLALVMVLSLAACGKSPAPDTTPDDTPAPDDAPEYFVVGEGVYRNEKELDEKSIDRAIGKFKTFAEDYCGDAQRVFLGFIPSKNGYLNAENGHLNEAEFAILQSVYDKWGSNFIDLSVCLTLEDYYRTDTHWRQEQLLNVAERICKAMGVSGFAAEELTQKAVEQPFYGVYYGQAALPMEPETMYYLTGQVLENCTVYNFETGKTTAVYDMEKLQSRDLYDIYLSGAAALLEITNPTADSGKELVVFRDSFGSSLIPLLLKEYAKITVVDTRYIAPQLLTQYLQFDNQDVLFLYSTLILNSSSALK